MYNIEMIKFIVDSGSDISFEALKKYGIDLLPLIVELDEKEYRPYRDITGEEFRELLKNTKSFPKTAAVSSYEVANTIRPHIENGDEVIMVMMSKKGSSTFNYIHLAKKQLEEEFGRELPISAVDSMNYSLAYLHPVYDAVELANSGKTRQEIVDFLNKAYTKQQLMFMMTDLSYLKRGGRIKTGTAIVGEILGIVPILHVNDGLVEPIGKERGIKRAIESMLQIMKEKCPSKKIKRVQVTQCSREKEAKEIENLIKTNFEVEEFLPITSPEASITVHAGMDFIGIAYSAD